MHPPPKNPVLMFDLVSLLLRSPRRLDDGEYLSHIVPVNRLSSANRATALRWLSADRLPCVFWMDVSVQLVPEPVHLQVQASACYRHNADLLQHIRSGIRGQSSPDTPSERVRLAFRWRCSRTYARQPARTADARRSAESLVRALHERHKSASGMTRGPVRPVKPPSCLLTAAPHIA